MTGIHGASATTRGLEPRNPSPGQSGIVMLGLAVGILLMAVQLWLLTLALNLFLLGDARGTLIAAIVSGCIFAGGLLMLRVLRRPSVGR